MTQTIIVPEFNPEFMSDSISIDDVDITVWDMTGGCELEFRIDTNNGFESFMISLDNMKAIVNQAEKWYNIRESQKGTMP